MSTTPRTKTKSIAAPVTVDELVLAWRDAKRAAENAENAEKAARGILVDALDGGDVTVIDGGLSVTAMTVVAYRTNEERLAELLGVTEYKRLTSPRLDTAKLAEAVRRGKVSQETVDQAKVANAPFLRLTEKSL